MTALDQDYEEDADPAAAFEALRLEVAKVLHAIERSSAAAPDYSPTLAQISQCLAFIEQHPALRYTPQSFASETRAAVEGVHNRTSQAMDGAAKQMNGAAADLTRLVGAVRVRQIQTYWVVGAAACGLLLGIALWVGLSGPIARKLPKSWAVPEMMAAATMNMDLWQAGERLMQAQNPAGWKADVDATNLVGANIAAVTACQQLAAHTARPQRCVVKVAPPGN